MKWIATSSVGSHLDSIAAVERGFQSIGHSVSFTIVEFVGFNRWDSTHLPYFGAAERRRLYPGPDRLGSLSSWRSLRRQTLRLFNELEPEGLLILDDTWFGEAAFLSVAKERKLPVVLLQEGPFRTGIDVKVSQSLFQRLLRIPEMDRYGGGGADCHLVSSRAYLNQFQKAGVTSAEVIGIPRYDPLTPNSYASKRRSLETVLYLSQPFVRYEQMSVDQYARVIGVATDCLNATEAVVDIRTHPSETKKDIELIRSGLKGSVRIVDASTPLLDCLGDYDAVVGVSSNGLIEASLLGIPAFFIDCEETKPFIEFFQKAGLPALRNQGDLVLEAFRPECLNHSVIEQEVGVLDQKAGSRAARRMMDLVP